MAWADRLKEAAYVSPSGARFPFAYENVSREVDKQTAAFQFPDADGTYVQDLGVSGRRYPLRVIFWGEDYDLTAQAFEEALTERGAGRLEHPLYGTFDVVPFGTITRRDDLKDAANQAILEVTFWETIGIVYPTTQTDPASEVQAAISDYNAAAAATFEEQASLETAVEQASFKNVYNAVLTSAKDTLRGIADAQEDVSAQFRSIEASIDAGIDTLVRDPLTLASQTVQLLQAPARAATAFRARLGAYQNLATNLIAAAGVATRNNDARPVNAFHTNDLFVSTYISAPVVAALNATFETRAAALEAAEQMLADLETAQAWREANFASLSYLDPLQVYSPDERTTALRQIDTGAAFQGLQKAVALTAGFLVELSFSLKQERRLVTDRDRTVIDLVAELYGSVDDQLDFFIQSNNLSGSEILEIPRGRELVYYV